MTEIPDGVMVEREGSRFGLTICVALSGRGVVHHSIGVETYILRGENHKAL